MELEKEPLFNKNLKPKCKKIYPTRTNIIHHYVKAIKKWKQKAKQQKNKHFIEVERKRQQNIAM